MQHHKYSLSELEAMMPWERNIYISLISRYVHDENERIKLEKQQAAARK